MSTVNIIALHLLTHFSPEERDIPDNATYPGRNAAVLSAINGALQEMYGISSPWIAYDERGVILQPPTTIPIALTNGSTTGTIEEADWKAWMAGCTIQIEGEPNDNQIRNDSRTVRLRFPFSGTTGTKQATVYHDSITLDDDVLAVHEPLKLDGVILPPVASVDSLVMTNSDRDFGFHRRTTAALVRSVATAADFPRAWCIESWQPTPNSIPESRIRLTPAPSHQGSLQYRCKLNPPQVTSLLSGDLLPVPHNYVDSIFLPIAEKRLSGSPFWRGILSPDSLAQNYSAAVELLRRSNPRVNRGLRFITRY